MTSLFALIDSIDIRKVSGYDLIWYENGLYIVSFIITIATIIIVFGLMILHYCVWEPAYNKTLDEETERPF